MIEQFRSAKVSHLEDDGTADKGGQDAMASVFVGEAVEEAASARVASIQKLKSEREAESENIARIGEDARLPFRRRAQQSLQLEVRSAKRIWPRKVGRYLRIT